MKFEKFKEGTKLVIKNVNMFLRFRILTTST